MVGYFGWTIERSAANDAFLPILADGVKWTGHAVRRTTLVYNVGWFVDTLIARPSRSTRTTGSSPAASVWLPLGRQTETLLHLAVEARFGDARRRHPAVPSKPESFLAQSYAVDTGKFAADRLDDARARGVLPARVR